MQGEKTNSALGFMARVEFVRKSCAILWLGNNQNRFRTDYIENLMTCLDEVEKSNAKALVTSGTGKFFSNGLDLEWVRQQRHSDAMHFFRSFQLLLARMLSFPMVTVAALNGHTAAGGALFALAHDYRVMQRDRGWMFLNEVDLGILFTEGMLSLIRSKVPTPSVFRDFVIYGNRFSGSSAVDVDLVDRVCDVGSSLDAALDLAEEKVNGKGIPKENLGAMKRHVHQVEIEKLKKGAMASNL